MRRLMVGALSLVVAIGTIVVSTGPAAAYNGYAGVHNKTYRPVLAAKNWCGPGSSTQLPGDEVPYYDGCGGTEGLGYNPSMVLFHDQHTPDSDWDTFKVEKGCKVYWSITILNARDSVQQYPIDRRGFSTGLWVRIHDFQTAIIDAVDCETPDDDGASNPPQPQLPPWEPPPPPVSEPPATIPSSIAVKRNDYHKDGVSDLVGTRVSDGCIARWRGNGNGGLDYVGDYGCGWQNYTELTGVGDINRDGVGDLVAVRKSDGCLARWTGNSSFGFTYIGDYGCGWDNYTQLTGAGDINRDGVGDLVAVRKSNGCLARWKGNGNGGLDYIGDYGCGWQNYTELTGVGDISGDGVGDLVAVRSANGCIARWVGYGNGGFTYVGDYGCGWEQYAKFVGLGDLNRDGVGDLVAVRKSDGCIARWTGNRNGGLTYIGDYGCGWQNYEIA